MFKFLCGNSDTKFLLRVSMTGWNQNKRMKDVKKKTG